MTSVKHGSISLQLHIGGVSSIPFCFVLFNNFPPGQYHGKSCRRPDGRRAPYFQFLYGFPHTLVRIAGNPFHADGQLRLVISPSDPRMASSTGVRPSRQTQRPLNFSFLQPKQEIQPVYFSMRNRSNRSTFAPADSAPIDASVISVSVFQPMRGPAFTATIFLLIFITPLSGMPKRSRRNRRYDRRLRSNRIFGGCFREVFREVLSRSVLPGRSHGTQV